MTANRASASSRSSTGARNTAGRGGASWNAITEAIAPAGGLPPLRVDRTLQRLRAARRRSGIRRGGLGVAAVPGGIDGDCKEPAPAAAVARSAIWAARPPQPWARITNGPAPIV